MTTATVTRHCQSCDADLGPLARPNQRHCTGTSACRVRASRARARDRQLPMGSQPGSPLSDWLARSPAVSPELALAVEEATSEVRLVGLVARAAASNWRAAAWLLERRYTERWSPQRADKDAPTILDDAMSEFDELAERRGRKPPGY